MLFYGISCQRTHICKNLFLAFKAQTANKSVIHKKEIELPHIYIYFVFGEPPWKPLNVTGASSINIIIIIIIIKISDSATETTWIVTTWLDL